MISEEFLDWTKDNGLSYPSLEAALVEEGWRGLICTKSLRAGEPICNTYNPRPVTWQHSHQQINAYLSFN